MISRNFRFWAISICLILCSCTEDGDNSPNPTPKPPVNEQIPINLSVGVKARATDTSFENDDAIGLYVVNYENGNPSALKTTGNHVNNMKFTHNSGNWTAQSTIYWKDETTKADFYCFYPHATVSNIEAHSFALKADQSTSANYNANIFLWGKAPGISPTSSPVPITVNHLFSQAIIKVEAGTGFTADELDQAEIKVSMHNIKTNATVNLATGVATATGAAVSVTPMKIGNDYRAFIVPQTVSADNFITVNVDGRDYKFNKDFTFEANKQHTFTIKVTRTDSGIQVVIGGWDTDDVDHGGEAV